MPQGDELPQGLLLEPVDHDPFVDTAPPSGNIMDPASQQRSAWADSPLAKVGRLIGERGLAGAMPGRTIKSDESMPAFWKRRDELIRGLKTTNGETSTQPAEIKLEPVDHNPFADPPPGQERGPMDKLLGLTGERYQLWPERMVRSAVTLSGDVASGRLPVTAPGLRRTDFTDIPGLEQPNDELVARAQDTTGLMVTGAIPSAMRGTVGAAGGRVPAAQTPSAPPFYSAVERTVSSAKIDKASPDQWAGYLRNQPGVKQEEMQWLGVDDWLKEQPGPVTKQQVHDYVRAN
ncbi:MAG: hypothetical protein Q7R45_01190, partial [Sulfuricaulis sp.]|nr:hypothetical protein [Sulfuricaulis sp.]